MIKLFVSTLLPSCFLIIVFTTSIRAQTADSLEQALLHHKQQANAAVTYGDKEQLKKAKKGFEQLSVHQEVTTLAKYYTAYADYRLSSLFSDISEDQKEQYLDDSIEHLEEVTETAPEFADGWALLGNCYGMKATGMFSAIRYGPKSDNAISKALELAPENPRVVMINGISLMYKPGMFGGSTQKAIEAFKKAATLFDQSQNDGDLQPDWGEAENYAWLAQAHIQQDELQQAQQAYQTSLQINADYYWVKEILLPELNQQMK